MRVEGADRRGPRRDQRRPRRLGCAAARSGTDGHRWDVRSAPRREGRQPGGRDGAGDREGCRHRAASRPRTAAWMLGAVGDDQLGVAALEALRANDVQTDHSWSPRGPHRGRTHRGRHRRREPDLGGAGRERLARAERRRRRARDVEAARPLVSLEVPERTARAALEWARDHDVTAILNPAPPQPWTNGLLGLATYVTPNEHERPMLGRSQRVSPHRDTRIRGAVIHRADGSEESVRAPSVPVVDTTGAGDCFNGVLAAGLAWGSDLSQPYATRSWPPPSPSAPPAPVKACPTSQAISEARERFGS